jgi:hypothetical protein
MSGDSYIPGEHYVYCDCCGFKTRSSQARRRWDGAIVCAADWEPRHPQDTLRARGERQSIKDARPEPENVFVGENEVQPSDL